CESPTSRSRCSTSRGPAANLTNSGGGPFPPESPSGTMRVRRVLHDEVTPRTRPMTLPRRVCWLVLTLFVALLAEPLRRGFGDDPPKKPGRVPWTTSRVVGSPDPPPPFKTVNAFPNVKLTHALFVGRVPGTDRLVMVEQTGKVVSFRKQRDTKP